jgi:hypothetical protein
MLREWPTVLLGIFLLAPPSARARPKFITSEIAGQGAQLMICDLDGDGLKDLVLLDETNLCIFYQDPKRGFTREPQQTFHLEARPSVVWTTKMGRPAGSVLVLNSDGVTELCFTNRTGPPARRQIIRQSTVIPGATEGTNVMCLSLSVETGGDWPLLLVPATDGLQVWQHRDDWRLAQVVGQALDAGLWPSLAGPGYTTSFEFDLSVGDVNGDGRDDLMVRRNFYGRTNTYCLYLQQTNGLFPPEPSLTYADKIELFSWHCWADLNRDGKVDLIKSVWLNEPSFIPGVPSGKVLVKTFIADAHGKLPAEPQQVFRKNDWVSALPVSDLDGDGFPDLVLGYCHMDSKESVTKEIAGRQLDYSLRFYFQRPGTGFSAEADCQRDIVVHLDHAEGPLDWSLPQNFERFVHLGGDFGGNGKSDLLVREHSDDISVYAFVSREKGFGPAPVLRFNCPDPIDEWQVADLNNDGVSDLIVKLAKPNGYRVFISQK